MTPSPDGWHQRIARFAARHWWRRKPSLLSWGLWPLSQLFAGLAALDRWAWLSGWRTRPTLPVPVVVVGNLVAGGAGKTPTVIATVHSLQAAGWRPGVISRGYGRSATQPLVLTPQSTAQEGGDEPVLIQRRTGAPVAVGPDRVATARQLLDAHPRVNVLVADDGLQHHRLRRQVQILVLDRRGVGNGLRLPAGPLRQGLPPRVPDRTLVLYNADQPTTRLPGVLAQRSLSEVMELAAWWAGEPGEPGALAQLARRSQDTPILAVAGLAEPERFFDMLEAAGLRLQRLPLADHAPFDTLPWPAETPDVLVTEKDAIKLNPSRLGTTRVWVVRLDFSLPPACSDALLALLTSSSDEAAQDDC